MLDVSASPAPHWLSGANARVEAKLKKAGGIALVGPVQGPAQLANALAACRPSSDAV